jgi:hypothetical protein
MTTRMTESLTTLLKRVALAPPSERMHHRQAVVSYGAAALPQLEPWLDDPGLATFAIQAIGRIGDVGSRPEALAMLTATARNQPDDLRGDIDEIMLRWGVPVKFGVAPRTGIGPKTPITLDMDLRSILIEGARGHRLLTYSEVGEPIGLTMKNPGHRGYLGKLLGAISEHEALGGRPLLSSIVVHKGDNWPGIGFLQLGQELRVAVPDEDGRTFAARQMSATFDYWQTHADPDMATS